jgi:hypothetical protein
MLGYVFELDCVSQVAADPGGEDLDALVGAVRPPGRAGPAVALRAVRIDRILQRPLAGRPPLTSQLDRPLDLTSRFGM